MNIHSCTIQKACDYAVQRIVKQGHRCMERGSDSCVYSDGQGNHCAVGWLFPEDKVLMEFEGTIDDYVYDWEHDVNDWIKENVRILRQLQVFHDLSDYRYRVRAMDTLKSLGIDTSGAHWHQWLEM